MKAGPFRSPSFWSCPLGVLGALLGRVVARFAERRLFQSWFADYDRSLDQERDSHHRDSLKICRRKAKGLIEATLEAVHLRLRPILMTSFAFILGVLPLALSNGAGSGSQTPSAPASRGGMIAATVLAIFLVPVFFVVVRRIFKHKPSRQELAAQAEAAAKNPDAK